MGWQDEIAEPEKSYIIIWHVDQDRAKANIWSPVMHRDYPLTNLGLQAMRWDESDAC
jgi:hypothetical protein